MNCFLPSHDVNKKRQTPLNDVIVLSCSIIFWNSFNQLIVKVAWTLLLCLCPYFCWYVFAVRYLVICFSSLFFRISTNGKSFRITLFFIVLTLSYRFCFTYIKRRKSTKNVSPMTNRLRETVMIVIIVALFLNRELTMLRIHLSRNSS